MSRFKEEFSIIPGPAKLIATLVYLCFAIFAWVMTGSDESMRAWADWQRLAFAVFIPAFLIVLVLLIGYVYADAKRRGMRYILWTLLATFLPQGTGIILYFILRDPLLKSCPQCGAMGKKGFAFCTNCGTALERACGQCRRAAERNWTHCAYCGASLPPM